VFPGHFPRFAESRGLRHDRAMIVRACVEMPLEYEPRTQVAYSDLGVITLGAVLEGLAGARLDQLAEERVVGRLGLRSTRYNPPPEQWPQVAPTEDDPWRGRVVQGEVHDECAWAMGGVSAHAGLFGSAADLAAFGQCLLNGGQLAGRRLVGAETLGSFTTRDGRVAGSDRALGWQVASPDNSAGPDLSPAAFGHTGFTGTSVWIDPPRRLVIVLLTNRVHPRRENVRIIAFRPALHSAVVGSVVD
jgi:CubicO group peptidase (beta-lactamase class C family)